MNSLLDEATTKQKQAAFGFMLIRVLLVAIALVWLAGLFRAFGPVKKPPKYDPTWLYFSCGALVGAFLMAKYFEDLLFASRHGFQVYRWFDTGLRRPMDSILPFTVAMLVGANIGEVISGEYWRLLMIFPYVILWLSVLAGYSPVIKRLRKIRKIVLL